MMMVFSNNDEKNKYGFDCYQTDNIYQFLTMAKEVRPDIVFMKFTDEFHTDDQIMLKIKEALCKQDVCPKIYMNMPKNFKGEKFFDDVDFEKKEVILSLIEKEKYLN